MAANYLISQIVYPTDVTFMQLIWLSDEKDLTFPGEADVFLMTFLRPCKFYSQSAFEKLQKYFKFKLKHKKICENITVDSVRVVFEDDLIKYLPLRDLNGRRLLYLNCGSMFSKFIFIINILMDLPKQKNGNHREYQHTTSSVRSNWACMLQWLSRWHRLDRAIKNWARERT